MAGLVVTPPSDSVYTSGPVIITKDEFLSEVSEELRVCIEDAFPVCPNTNGPNGLPSKCPCTVRKNITIGGVVHSPTGVEFWERMVAAAEQGASDMGITLKFDVFDPQDSYEIIHQKMKSKILSF